MTLSPNTVPSHSEASRPLSTSAAFLQITWHPCPREAYTTTTPNPTSKLTPQRQQLARSHQPTIRNPAQRMLQQSPCQSHRIPVVCHLQRPPMVVRHFIRQLVQRNPDAGADNHVALRLELFGGLAVAHVGFGEVGEAAMEAHIEGDAVR